MSAALMKGVLRGMGREVLCELLVWKETVGNRPVYSQCRVVTAPLDLPDGEYVLLFDGRTVPAKKQGGWWAMEGLG
ncbi:MAG TPA: hypothetical protein VGF88_09210 [Acidobacteriaceae bacterium]|jgi:hypothetical protein